VKNILELTPALDEKYFTSYHDYPRWELQGN